MGAVLEAMEPLDVAARLRVVEWILARFGLASSPRGTATATASEAAACSPAVDRATSRLSDFGSVADAFSASGPPKTETRKALVVAAYLQSVGGRADVTGFDVNSELKHLGHAVGNITLAMTGLMNARPQLVVQVRKTGSTKQARKSYRVTVEGLREVERMLSSGGGEEQA